MLHSHVAYAQQIWKANSHSQLKWPQSQFRTTYTSSSLPSDSKVPNQSLITTMFRLRAQNRSKQKQPSHATKSHHENRLTSDQSLQRRKRICAHLRPRRKSNTATEVTDGKTSNPRHTDKRTTATLRLSPQHASLPSFSLRNLHATSNTHVLQPPRDHHEIATRSPGARIIQEYKLTIVSRSYLRLQKTDCDEIWTWSSATTRSIDGANAVGVRSSGPSTKAADDAMQVLHGKLSQTHKGAPQVYNASYPFY